MFDDPTSLDNIGRTFPIVVACDCGETHTSTGKIVASDVNRALATSVIDNVDFVAQRAWIREHRAHGGNITQPCRAA
ncbi:hypothetical protein [Nocardia sp. SC052]|uniref:hypothetical protein n=1 Tax=Nocardia sichangensis TaxID=3385975 RepID=UPI0039A0AE29